MANAPNELNEILIVRVTPQFLERGALWFSENLSSIKKAGRTSPIWKHSAFFIEKGGAVKPSQLLRLLADFGYEKTERILSQGEYVWRGNILEVWPINAFHPVRIEWFGNTIEAVFAFKRETNSSGPKISYSASLEKLPPDSFIVHLDHGIGIYRGTVSAKNNAAANQQTQKPEKRRLSAAEEETLYAIEYASPQKGGVPDMLYVPRSQAKKLSPYIGFDTPAVHRLGGTVWFSTKRKTKEAVESMAKELLELYKKRARAVRDQYNDDPLLQKEFEDGFVHEETPGQRIATEEVRVDMLKPRPMDRIVCGDVGFGKTEVAVRAAFRAVHSGKQVAILAPTTILADQHARNFEERFRLTAVEIAILSRLTAEKEKREILEKLKHGGIDIVIGTHRLLSKDVVFKNLGLVIIDEEQKFGVKQKERFKELRSEVDVLLLSATPIPRTLSMALAKLRDISVIETPPTGRIPIKTIVIPYSTKIIRKAVQKEFARGGQVYFLHNRIETIGLFKERLQKAVPGAAIAVIHGRMPEKTMIGVMRDFRNGKFNVLLATTIIENGLDFSNVNTLIVEDGTRLGLAQAHQIRGRVGRSDKQAYAYFLYRAKQPTDKALERLQALREFSELGSGYEIALRDLEIRGAGNVLGQEQSGAINKVGFNLYCQILNETLETLYKEA